MKKTLAKLLDIKSVLAILLTVIFFYLCITEKNTTEFITIYTVCVTFYFGSSVSQKKDE